MSMLYISTRGKAPAVSFDEAVLAGLAPDGGLYVPEAIPMLSTDQIARLAALSYPELAYEIISRFTGESIAPEALEKIIAESYKQFSHAAIAPLKQLDAHTFILELFHGPTLAFKDFALQFLGRLLDHMLQKRKQRAVVLGATSGDTGSAAIAACRGRKQMDIVILHPKGRVSNVQRRQMTTVADKNVHNIAIKGTFDDCQDIVKALFSDELFARKHRLAAVNSINWARIVAQIPYYFYAALRLGAPANKVSFSVPTGNFGDIYAGYIAKRMGLPVDQLIIASNKNDILPRTLAGGIYGMGKVAASVSPSMDIQVSSNFERLLFDVYDRDGAAVAQLMAKFRADKKILLSPQAQARLKSEFAGVSVSDADTLKTIRDTYKKCGELLDPHTAVGLAAGERSRRDTGAPMVALATAHPAKFPDAVKKATGVKPPPPKPIAALSGRKERCKTLENSAAAVKRYLELHIK